MWVLIECVTFLFLTYSSVLLRKRYTNTHTCTPTHIYPCVPNMCIESMYICMYRYILIYLYILNIYLSIYLSIYIYVNIDVKNPPAMQKTPVPLPGSGRSPGKGIGYPLQNSSSLMSQMVKSPPAKWETRVQSLGWEDPLEEGMATHSSITAWRMPMDRGAWWATVHGATKSRTWPSS